jgi:hypothetical protein
MTVILQVQKLGLSAGATPKKSLSCVQGNIRRREGSVTTDLVRAECGQRKVPKISEVLASHKAVAETCRVVTSR